jgi:hypothetical protein
MTANIGKDSLDWALAHAERYGDTDIFPTPFEIRAIRNSWDSLRDWLARQDLDTWSVRVLRKCMAPKGRFAYRVATQLDPLDFLFYTALVYEIGSDLERFRLPSSEQVVHSFRFAPSDVGRMFDPSYGYSTFLQRCQELTEEGSFDYVVATDIADFFPRVYFHRIESAFQLATAKVDQARALLKLLKGWNERVSYGIPVGPAASRLIAEATLQDVDECLLAEGTIYCRYSDDFRIFCKSKAAAYSKLETLALVLQQSHGLSLQPGKTDILPTGQFKRKYLETPYSVELQRLREHFGDIVEKLGLEDPYEELDYDNLDKEAQNAIDSLNLYELLEEQLSREDIDIGLFRFVLRRLGQLNQSIGVEPIFAASEKCYPVVSAVVSYIGALKSLESHRMLNIGKRLISVLKDSLIGQLPFHRCWLLNLFSESGQWGQQKVFPELYAAYPDPFTQRKLILALGHAKQQYWFRRMRGDVMQLSPWSRRAFLAASSCMAPDEAKHWHGSIKGRVDALDKVIIEWAKANPFYADY